MTSHKSVREQRLQTPAAQYARRSTRCAASLLGVARRNRGGAGAPPRIWLRRAFGSAGHLAPPRNMRGAYTLLQPNCLAEKERP
jgi:hypothetical protein